MRLSTSGAGADPRALLARLRRECEQVSAEAAAAEVERLVARCFAAQAGPDGTPWPPRADGSGRPLLLGIAGAVEVYAEAGAVYVDEPGKPHADYQKRGTRTIPARPWAPEPGAPLPPAWAARVGAAVRRALRRASGGR